jgi:hypothetical protein
MSKPQSKTYLLEPGLLRFWLAEQLRKFGKNGGDQLRLVARQQHATPKPAKRLLFETVVGIGYFEGYLPGRSRREWIVIAGRQLPGR